MCYSQSVSAALALGGWAVVVWLVAVGRRSGSASRVPPLVYPYAFYALMETLQTLQYGVLDECGQPANYALTLVAHVLVAVQPCMWNLYRLARARRAAAKATRAVDLAETARQRDAAAVFAAAAAMSAVLGRLFHHPALAAQPGTRALPPTATFTAFRQDEIMVGPEVCTLGGPTHLFWVLPYAARNGWRPTFSPTSCCGSTRPCTNRGAASSWPTGWRRWCLSTLRPAPSTNCRRCGAPSRCPSSC
ncbi:hypothetical protein TW95_gp1265 [Pandoravirus inopinatum]|uniref:Putative membrane protein n=1 Tax=Pandoravirus inopinatum TaxID=1605721 RepID=A0A0B5J332_9VIRU|nr:hypothetical protein TW95_gp1265 [Pandoravirus inopinatum]AJF97999.1 putative membrane protein [Pandoravirus inopinatum]